MEDVFLLTCSVFRFNKPPVFVVPSLSQRQTNYIFWHSSSQLSPRYIPRTSGCWYSPSFLPAAIFDSGNIVFHTARSVPHPQTFRIPSLFFIAQAPRLLLHNYLPNPLSNLRTSSPCTLGSHVRAGGGRPQAQRLSDALLFKSENV